MSARIFGTFAVDGTQDALRVTGGGASFDDARLAVVVDGAVYNRAELGSDRDDASLVARLYQRHGIRGCIDRLNGDFAIAMLDRSSGTLWLARDRFGLQPLYYARTGRGLAFASQPGALFDISGVSRDVDERFVSLYAGSHYRMFDNEPHRSPYRDIVQLPAAHILKMHDGAVSVTAYWSLDEQDEFHVDEQDLAQQYRELIADSVRVRLRSARRPAFTLSGGMDSSTVVATAGAITGQQQDAFSTVYEDPTFDERGDIIPMLENIVGRWHAVPVEKPDLFAVVDRMIAAHHEPVATATWLSHFELCEQVAAGGYDVLFGGLGGDELNAGEYEYFPFHFADLHVAGQQSALRHEVARWVEHHDHPVHRKTPELVDQLLSRLVDFSHPGRCLADLDRMLRYAPALGPAAWDVKEFRPVMETPFSSYLKNRAFQDLTRETAPCCLRAEDRDVNAFGLRRSDPFFDHRLVEFMFRVPGSMKIRDGVTKRLLREAMRGVLPEETRTRIKKTGWNAPAHQWFTGTGADDIRDLIRSAAFRDRGIYDVDVVERLLDEHEAIVESGEPRENHMMFFWQLLNLELWLQYLGRGTGTDSS